MKDRIYHSLPNFFQNVLISLFNILAYRKRYGGKYKLYRAKFYSDRMLSLSKLKELQKENYSKLLNYAVKNSAFYKAQYKGIEDYNKLENIGHLPILSKEQLRSNCDSIFTIPKKDGIVSKTGGTTGKSLEVIFTKDNMQERFAMLDNFRNTVGYEIGIKTAWFSGKNLLGSADVKKRRFWKTDYYHNVRYYSTFHIKEEYLEYYLNDLIKYKPRYLVGFPSTMVELARYGSRNKIDFPSNQILAIFPTAETITHEIRSEIERFFKTRVLDQYASSEGAPFIFECNLGKLHLELQSGVFEVLDKQNKPAATGRLVLTSFTSYGTPLIRYDIEDGIELSDEICDCGNNNPLVNRILGRIDDYVYSPLNGKINLGNVSNTLKDTKGIVKFQVIQEQINHLTILLMVDKFIFNDEVKSKFIENWRDRVGKDMHIELEIVEEIAVEKSGKFRLIKNKIKRQID